MKKLKAILSYIWIIISNLFIIIIVLSMFDRINRGFEVMVVSLLIIIFCYQAYFLSLWGTKHDRALISLAVEFAQMRRLLNKDISEEDKREEDDKIMKALKDSESLEAKKMLGYVFISIVIFICFFNILFN